MPGKTYRSFEKCFENRVVFVIDDEKIYRSMLGEMFRDLGVDVHVFEKAEDAIDQAARLHPDLLVADWLLNGEINGMQVATEIQSIHPEVKLIVMSGSPSANFESDLGFELLSKPFREQEIIDIASQLLSEREIDE